MSDFNIEIINPQNNTIEIENSLSDTITNLDIILINNTTLEIVNTEKILPSDFPNTYPFTSIIGDVPYTRVSGLTENTQDIIGSSLSGISGINISYNDNSGFTTISLSDPVINTIDIIDFNSGVSGLLPIVLLTAGSGIGISGVGSNYTISTTGTFGLTQTQVDSRVNTLISGNYSIFGHTHTISNITGLQTELDNKQASGNYSLAGHSHNISDITLLQTTLDSKQPSGSYALSSHTHTSSNITDFNSSVSGLINVKDILGNNGINIENSNGIYTITNSFPVSTYALGSHTHVSSNITDFNTSVSGLLPVKNITGTGYVTVSSTTGNYIVSVTGLQPSGSYASSSHTHSSSDITNFNTSVSGLVNGIYAPLSSPSLIGTPLTPTAPNGTNNTQIASTAFVRTEISNLVASAPAALDTLNELATALGNDANFSTTVTNNLAGKANLSGATFTGSVSGPSGNFTSLKVNSVDVSANGHTHTVSNITDFNSSVSGLLPVGTANYLSKFGTGGSGLSNSLVFDDGTNIGIGTASPSNRLEVAGGNVLIGPSDPTRQLNFYSSSYGIKAQAGLEVFTGDIIRFRKGSTEYARIDANGKVGIGTTTPSGQLHVNGTGIFNSGIYISDLANGTYINGNSSVMDFFVNNNRSMRISPYGTVAINRGTASALGALHVQGNGSNPANTSDPMIVTSSVGSGSIIRFTDSASNDWQIGVNPNGSITTGTASGNFAITRITSNSGIPYLTISSSGNVGIGTTNPQYKLDVNGNVNIDGNLTFDSFTESVVAIGNSSTSQTISLTSGTVQTCTLTGNCTFTMPTATAGKSFSLFLNTGSGSFTASFTGVRWNNSTAPTITSTASKVDLLSFISDGSYWYGSFSQNYG